MEKQTPINRLNYSGNFDHVVDRICSAYGLFQKKGFFIIDVGYEDCNVVIETAKSKYLAKIFSKVRSPHEVGRYTGIIQKVFESGINHPELIKTKNGNFVYTDSEANRISMVLMKFISGKTFFEMNRAPDTKELRLIIKQAAKINNIDFQPSYRIDSWAIPNIKSTFKKVQKFIDDDDAKLVRGVISGYDKIPLNSLPHCFVHGDFTKTNIIKSRTGKMYILDFSVANWYPRIQELAVITANLLYDENNPMTLREKSRIVADEYSKFNPLTADERNHLYSYTLAGAAMEFLGSHQERYINGNDTKETQYWLDLGRETLRKELK